MNASLPVGRSKSGLVSAFVRAQIALALAHSLTAQAAPPAAPLPVPCVANCGSNPAATPFVSYGNAGATSAGKNLTVTQSSNAAILNWQQFNIDKGYSVDFKQPNATSSTLNRVWSADPSKISGSLTANGQVYLINQNGIVFGAGAQVNTGGLTASTLNISDDLYTKGLLSQNNVTGSVATVLPAVFDSGGSQAGTVTVESGATLTSSSGGRIILIGTAVNNAGKIATKDGQAILAAGNSVYLAASTDPALRGLLVEVNSAQLPAGSTVTNTGEITAARGSVTLAGLVVNQAGHISATTSVNSNGSIALVAGDTSSTDDPNFYKAGATTAGFGTMLPNKGGTLTLASGSVTEVQADATDTGTLNGTQTLIPSSVDLVGKSVTVKSGAAIQAPAGKVTVTAADDPFLKVSSPTSPTLDSDGSDILIEKDALIDTSGLRNVSVAATRNLIDVRLSSNDLQDDPLLRDGFLHGQTVTIDLSIGSTLFDTTAYKANVVRGISELLTAGGSINLNSNGSAITRSGATLNVSGGTIAYQGGFGKSTTKLLGVDGKVYDIGNAPKNIQYVGFANQFAYTDPTWGTKTTATSQSYHAAYLQGADAGAISILAPELYFRGTALGDTTPGIMQRSLASLPKGGSFIIGDPTQFPTNTNLDYRAPSLTLADGASDTLAVDFDPAHGQVLAAADLANSILSPGMLRAGGFSNIGLYSNGAVTLESGNTLTAANGGSIKLSGQSVELDGNIRIPSGQLTVTTSAGIRGATPDTVTDVVVGPGAQIDMSGTWINDSPLLQVGPGTAALTHTGGTVSLQSAGSVLMGTGSLVDVSGGGWIDSGNHLTAGAAGSIELSANNAPLPPPVSGKVELGGTLKGVSLAPAGGGTLSIRSASVTVGHNTRGTDGELLLTPDFFMQGGFRNYAITGQNSLVIGTSADPVTITPLQQNLMLNGSPLLQRTGASLADFTTLETLPEWQRSAANVSFTASATNLSGSELGSLVLGAGSSIVTNPGATVSLAASGLTGNLTVLGKISAPAGKINLTLGSQSSVAQLSDPGYIPGQQLLLGPDAVLSATASAQTNTANNLGYRQGSELAGGSISLNAWKGYIVTNPGSLIDVSGGQTVIDVITPTGVKPATIAGNAGSIAIDAREGLVLGGQLTGKATDVPGAAGGTLTVGLDLSNYVATTLYNQTPKNAFPTTERVLTLTDQPATQLSPLLQSGQAQISTNTLMSGGFDNITLKSADVVAMAGDVHLAAKGNLVMDAPVLRGSDTFTTSLSAAHLSLGYLYNLSGQTQETLATAATGTGKLTGNAQLIDIRGTSVFEGFDAVNLNSSGDVRLTFPQQVASGTLAGSLLLGGDINITAAQIYPTTLTAFKIQSPGTVSIGPAPASSTVPLSAGGSLQIDAQKIVQQGVLRAPAGQISLNATGGVTLAAGSVTSVSTEGLIIPEGFTQNGNQWLYATDATANGVHIVTAPAAKEININAPDVAIDAGAKVDLSGGGDIYAYEFVAGQGGSKDVLANGGSYTYAIVPKLGSQFAPIDAEYSAGSAATGSQTITLTGVPGIPDGTYALLPARYALLPGAYAVQVSKSNSDLAVGPAIKQPDGTFVTAARLGQSGTNVLDTRTSTVVLASSTVVRSSSQINDSYGSSFFTSVAAAGGKAAPAVSADAGELTLSATKSLTLQSAIQFNTGSYQTGVDSKGNPIMAQGRGGTVAVVAPTIAVVDQLGPVVPEGELDLVTADLNRLGAAVLLLGATRSFDPDGEVLTVGAQTVELRNSASNPLSAPEIVLAGTISVLLDAGSGVKASGAAPANAESFKVNGDGALFLASTGPSTKLVRTLAPSTTPVGTLTVASGASMISSGSLFLDGAGDTVVASDAHIDTSALSISSSRVSLGDAPAGVGGVDLTTELLAGLSGLKSLNIVSASTIDMYGTVSVGTRDSNGQPLLANLALSAAALNGYSSGDKTFTAGAISFDNATNRAATTLATPDGTGSLNFNAMSSNVKGSGLLTLGAGSKTITGFSGVNMTAGSQILGDGVGTLQVAQSGTLSLQSTRLSTTAGADQQILNDVGRVSVGASGGATGLPMADLGGRLSITSTAIDQNGNIELPAGILTLHATGAGGDVTLGSGSTITAAGGVRAFADTYAVADAGRVNLISDQGNVSLANSGKIDLSGVTAPDKKTSGNAGTLSVSAIHGSFVNDGTLAAGAATGQIQGNFGLDVQSLGDFSKLNGQLVVAGFTGGVSLRTRTGDVTIATGNKVVANSFVLAADSGSINVLGSIITGGGNALSGDGGPISLWAGNNLTIASSAVLNSNAGAVGVGGMDSRGGSITLGSTAGVVDLQNGSQISLVGTSAQSDGALTVRAPRTSNTDLAVSELRSTVNSSKPIILEGVRTYTASTLGGTGDGAGNLAVDTSGVLFADTQAFVGAGAAIATRLGVDSSRVQVRAEIEIQSTSDLTLTGNWNLADDWKIGGAPVDVTLRAGANLILNGSLSDGFSTTDPTLALTRWTFSGGDSANLRLAAGADLVSANPLAVAQGTGDFSLADGRLVRTGTGNIDVAAGHDVKLLSQSSVIYTAGVPAVLTDEQAALFPNPKPAGAGLKPAFSYTKDGGSITVTAGNDVTAAPTSQLASDWLWRRGAVNADGTIADGQNTTWWINFQNFQQGIGALGGGNITVQAAGNINNLSAVIPTTGRLLGAAGTKPQASNLVVTGGGTLMVNAGRNIASGVFEDDRGNAHITAGDAFIAGRKVSDTNPGSNQKDLPVHTAFLLGNGTFDVDARSGLQFGVATNATILPVAANNYSQYPTSPDGNRANTFFYSVAPTTTLNLASAAGDVEFATDNASSSAIASIAPSATHNLGNFDYVNLSVLPPSIHVASFSGDITLAESINSSMLPSATGNLNLLAYGSINASKARLQMFESDPALVPNVLRPSASLNSKEGGTGGNLDSIPLPLTPLYQGSSDPIRVVARTGDINAEGAVFTFPKSAELVAAGDIGSLTYFGKNLNASDVTAFEAGGRIVFDTLADPVTGALSANGQGITVAGPGYLELLAGSGIDLGDSVGILTSANLNDSRLPSTGAALIAAAGLGTDALGLVRQPAYQSFTNAYLTRQKDGSPSIYAKQLVDYLAKLDQTANGGLSYNQALTEFEALAPERQLPFLSAVLSNELSETGLAHTKEGLPYDRGYTAVETLFPSKDATGNALAYKGDINLSFSQMKTEQGGSIDLLAPGGSVIVGLPNPPASLADIKALATGSAAANLGILVLGSGTIHGLADQNFNVNQSRMLTLEGGDIILWASNGNIDAGKGAKTASGAPPPVIQTDAQGNVFVNPVNSVAGSGIGQLLVKPNLTPGLVNLIAPKGTVDAGDAGIRVAGNLNIAAVAVIGASNITVGGTASGVPVSDAGALSGALSGANSLGDAGKSAVDQIAQNLGSSANFQQLTDSLQPAFIVVRMFCLGVECDAR